MTWLDSPWQPRPRRSEHLNKLNCIFISLWETTMSSLACYYCEKTLARATLRAGGLFDSVSLIIHSCWNSGQELKQEPAGQNWSRGQGGTLLIALLSMACLLSLLSRITQDCQPNVAPLTTGQALPHPNISQGNTQTCPQNNLIETIAQLRFSFPKYVKVCVNLQANQRRPPPHSLNVNSPWAVHAKHVETLTQYQPGPPPPPLHAMCARRTWNHSKFDLNQMKIV